MRELFSIKSVHILNRSFLVSLLVFAKITTQHSLLKMLELWKETLNKVGAIFMNLSKAFDTLNHDLLIAKHEAYGCSENSLNYIQSYYNRLQRTNVNINFILEQIYTRPPNI